MEKKKGITIYNLKKMAEKDLPIGECTTMIAPSVVKSVEQMLQENKQKQMEQDRERLRKEKAEFEKKSAEEANKEIGQKMPFSEMMKGLRDEMKAIYPQSSFYLMGMIPVNEETNTVVMEYYAKDEKLIATALCESMQNSKMALQMVNQAIMMFCESAGKDESEQAVTALQDMIKRLQERNSTEARVKLIQAEIKRLNKACRFDLVKIKEAELKKLKQLLEKRQRMKMLGKQNWRKAQEALAEKRRKAKQREKDQNRQQPNFAKMAKKKMQQIKERKAERNQRKSAGNGGDSMKSCSMFNNVG